MEELGLLILTALVTAGITAAISYAFWLKKKDKEDNSFLHKRIQKLEQEILVLKAKAVSEPQVRGIVSEEVKTIREEISGVKGAISELTGLIGNLRVELGILNYIKEQDRE